MSKYGRPRSKNELDLLYSPMKFGHHRFQSRWKLWTEDNGRRSFPII